VKLLAGVLLAAFLSPLNAQLADAPPLPKVLSLFPLGGTVGDGFSGQIRGTGLDGTYAVWFDAPGLSGRIKNIQEIRIEPEGKPGADEKSAERCQSVQVELQIGSNVAPGVYSLRLLSAHGISNPLPFPVSREPVVNEQQDPHNKPDQPQALQWPVILNGRIDKPGESDFYAFHVSENQELAFEVFSRPARDTPANKGIQSGFDSQLVLYEPGGSWFDPVRVKSLAFNDDPLFASVDANPRIEYRFRKAGRYLLEVRPYPGESLVSPGGPDYCYQLRVGSHPRRPFSAAATSKWDALRARSVWWEQSFERRIELNRLQELRLRSSDLTDKPVEIVKEYSPGDLLGGSTKITVPAVVNGFIAHPGDAQSYRFKVNAGERLAFEIETAEVGPPQFNPLLTVLDAEGREVFTNVYLRIGRNPNYRKTVQPKVLHTFGAGGEFTAQVRDITSRYGNSRFQYKLLIRPQIPHVGEIEVTEHVENADGTRADYPIDRINIAPGKPKKLRVFTSLEENFNGSVIVHVTGLPQGVEALPIAETEPDNTPRLDEGDKHRFLGKASYATFMLAAGNAGAIAESPRLIEFIVTPVHPNGSKARPLSVRQVPLMVAHE
jgi:hypothetical protein